ncbi:hypothetical protein ACHAXS_012781 [Conticribra weissflogii]
MTSLPPKLHFVGDLPASRAIQTREWLREERPSDDDPSPSGDAAMMVALLYGSWNVEIVRAIRSDDDNDNGWLRRVLRPPLDRFLSAHRPSAWNDLGVASVRVDADDESSELCCERLDAPSELPALVVLATSSTKQDGSRDGDVDVRARRLPVTSWKLRSFLLDAASGTEEILRAMDLAWSRLTLPSSISPSFSPSTSSFSSSSPPPPIRIFIAGDKSQVGKSSISLGILGSLLAAPHLYRPRDLAYIKPATQCERTPLIRKYCQRRGIDACVPVGPIVYHRGFTRAFLRREAGTTSEALLEAAARAVDEVSRGKKAVVIDGVGYPAVGSIVGTDNARVARACGRPTFDGTRAPAPVLLVGKAGVGDAVDSFNLNAAYFASGHVPVIGAVFNKLSAEGYYSLEKCKEAIDAYFDEYQPNRKVYGYVPELPALKLALDAVEHADDHDDDHDDDDGNEDGNVSAEEQKWNDALQAADAFVEEFSKRVNVHDILSDAERATREYVRIRESTTPTDASESTARKRNRDLPRSRSASASPAKIPRIDGSTCNDDDAGVSLTRAQIEAMASAAGAAGG